MRLGVDLATSADDSAIRELLRPEPMPGYLASIIDGNSEATGVLLRDRETDEIQGFSTFMRIEVSLEERDIVAFFSGDTIVAPQYWGESILSRLWRQTVFAHADRIVAARLSTKVFWFLICSGYKTFRFLPVFFRRFYPDPESRTAGDVQRIFDALGQAKFGDQYDAASGVVRLRRRTPLRRGVADVTE